MVCPLVSKAVLVPDTWKNQCKRKPLLASSLELGLWTGKSKVWVKEVCDALLPTYAHSCPALRHTMAAPIIIQLHMQSWRWAVQLLSICLICRLLLPQYKVILGVENVAHWSPAPTSL